MRASRSIARCMRSGRGVPDRASRCPSAASDRTCRSTSPTASAIATASRRSATPAGTSPRNTARSQPSMSSTRPAQQRVVARVLQRALQQRLAGLEVVVLELRPQDQRLRALGARRQPVDERRRRARAPGPPRPTPPGARPAPACGAARRPASSGRRQPHGVGGELRRAGRRAPPARAIGARLEQRGDLGVRLVGREREVARTHVGVLRDRGQRRVQRAPLQRRDARVDDGADQRVREADLPVVADHQQLLALRRRPARPRARPPAACGRARGSMSARPPPPCRAAPRAPAAGRRGAARWRRAATSAARGASAPPAGSRPARPRASSSA